jgi:hypothetical protein
MPQITEAPYSHEAAIFLSRLCLKSGELKEGCRNRIQEILIECYAYKKAAFETWLEYYSLAEPAPPREFLTLWSRIIGEALETAILEFYFHLMPQRNNARVSPSLQSHTPWLPFCGLFRQESLRAAHFDRGRIRLMTRFSIHPG